MADRGVMTGLKWWLDGYEFSGRFNAGSLLLTTEGQEKAAWSDNTRIEQPGLLGIRAEFGGLMGFGTGEPDDVLRSKLRVENVPLSVSPEAGAEGEFAYSFLSSLATYEPRAPHGETFRFDASAFATAGPLVGATIIHNAVKTATGDGTAFQVGAVGAGQTLYATMHVIAASGTSPTLDVIVESDSVEAFTGTPATQITFAQKTAIGSEHQTKKSVNTDTWWRVGYTIGGTSPSFTVVVLIGIL